MKDLSLGTSKARNVFLYILSNSFFIICAVSGPQQLLWLLIPPLWHSSNFPMSRALNVSQRSQIATSFQRVVLSFIPAPIIVNKERSTLRSCSCNLPSSMRCFSLGPVALAFQVDWNTFSDSGGRKKKKLNALNIFKEVDLTFWEYKTSCYRVMAILCKDVEEFLWVNLITRFTNSVWPAELSMF